MASRIGKYKVSKREAKLSAVDGAEIKGSLTGITDLSATGTSTFSGTSNVINGVDLTPNDIATTALGLNPTWRLNFGGATLAAGVNTTDVHLLDVLTPVNTLFRMALALKKVASQGSVVTAAQAGQIFGATSTAGALIPMTGVTDTATNFIPATLKVNTISGTTTANLTLDDSATNLNTDLDQSMILFNDYVIEAGHVVKVCFHADNEIKASANEIVTTAVAGTDQITRPTAASDTDRDIILTASGVDTTILAGSYIYLQAGADADEMSVKGCLRTTGGIIAVTYAA